MKIIKITGTIIILCVCLCFILFQRTYRIEQFYSDNSYEFNRLKQTFDIYFPEYNINSCRVKYILSKRSFFQRKKNMIYLSFFNRRRYNELIPHELSHIALSYKTNSYSTIEPNRFFDEGFANIIQNICLNKHEKYKQTALSASKLQLSIGNLSLVRVQDWDNYYDRYHNSFPFSYKVGSSFCYYIIDTYSDKYLDKFFKNISNDIYIDNVFESVFDKSFSEINDEWEKYIIKNGTLLNVDDIKFYPTRNSIINNDIDFLELIFPFPMTKKISIFCSESEIINYKNAYWKDENTLIIKLKNKLKPGTTYKVRLGDNLNWNFESESGLIMPKIYWTFKTNND